MLKTAVIGKKINGATQVAHVMASSYNKIILVDAVTGQSPKKVKTKIVDKDLYIFAEGSDEPSVIVDDYVLHDEMVQISGLGSGIEYVDYGLTSANTMELGASGAVPAIGSTFFMSSDAWWGVGILAVIGGVAAAAGGGGGGGSSSGGGSNPPPPNTSTHTATLVDSVVSGVTYTTSSGIGGVTGSDGVAGSFNYKTGDIVTFKVGNATIGTYDTAKMETVGIVTLQDIVGVDPSNTTDAKVVNIAQFLQSLDSDGNAANAIVINQTEASKITTTINVQTATDQELTTAIEQANPQNTLISESDAIAHLNIVANDTTQPTATITLSDTTLNSGETATVTIKFSEAVVGFTNTDVTVTNGTLDTLSSLDNITWTSTLTPTTNLKADTNVISIANTYTDAAGNTGMSATSPNYSVDTTVAPLPPVTVTITDDETAPIANIAGGEIVYTFTFNEKVNGFSTNDITVTNGTAGTFKQLSDTIYTLSVAPNAINSGEIAVNVLAGAATNSIRTPNEAAYTSYQPVDMVAPTATVTLADPALTIGETTIVTIAFSEAVANFDNSDVIAPNGTLSTFTTADGGSTWTALFTPTANISDASNVIQLLNTYTDIAGNGGEIDASGNFTIDTRVAPIAAPTLTLATDDATAGDGITHTNGMAVGGIIGTNTWEYSLNGGTTWTTGSGTSFNVVANTTYAAGDIQVRQIDASSNVSSIATNTQTTIVDTIGSTLTITDNEPNITANMDGSNADGTTDADGGDILYTFTFDEAVFGFDLADVTLSTGATAKTFTKISDTVYTLGVAPNADFEGSISAEVTNDKYTDIAGNQGDFDQSVSQAVDMKAPIFSSAVADVSKDSIIFTMDSVLNSVNKPDTGDFYVEIGGTALAPSDAISVAVNGTDVTLYIKDSLMNAGDSVRVVYDDTVGDIGNSIQDLAGNDAISFQYVGTAVL